MLSVKCETMHSNQELAEMHFMYGLGDGSAMVAMVCAKKVFRT